VAHCQSGARDRGTAGWAQLIHAGAHYLVSLITDTPYTDVEFAI
jgi:hypothetical protein